MRLRGEIRSGAIAGREDSVRDILQICAHVAVLFESWTAGYEFVPALRPRKKHRLEQSGAIFQRLRCRRIEDKFRAALGLGYAKDRTAEYVLVGEDAPRDVGPIRFPVVPDAGERLPL